MPPRLARLLAVIFAVVMVGAALHFVQRGRGGSGPTTGPGGEGDTYRITCVTELESVCRDVADQHPEVALTVEDAGVTEATLTKGSAEPPDAWVTLDPWPGMVDAGRDQANLSKAFSRTPTALAHTPLAAVMPADRYQALVKACHGKATWDCVAGNAGTPWPTIEPNLPAAQTWGRFKVGVGDPRTALGALFTGQIASSIAAAEGLGTDYGTNEFDDSMVQRLKAPSKSAPVQSTDDQLTSIVTQPGSYSLVASTAPAASRAVVTPRAGALGMQAVQIGPAARADAIVAPLTTDTRRATRIAGWFTDKTPRGAFDALGWSTAPATGSNGMPAADVLAALRQEIA